MLCNSLPLYLSYKVAGGSDAGETPIQTIQRECIEEAGFSVDDSRLIELPTVEAGDGKPVFRFLKIVGIKEIPETTSKLDPDNEVKAWNWYKFDNLPKDIDKKCPRYKSILDSLVKFQEVKGTINS